MKKSHLVLPAIATCIMLSLVFAGNAPAQTTVEQKFSGNLFQTAPGTDSFLTLEGASVPPGLSYFAGGLLHYQIKPIVVRECTRFENDGDCMGWGEDRADIIEDYVSMDLWGGITLFNVFEAGLVVPVVLFQKGENMVDEAGHDIVAAPGAATGMDDIRLHLKLDLWHGVFRQKGDTIGLALIPVLTFPTGNLAHEDAFMGDSSVTIHPKLAFTFHFGRLRAGLNAGYMWRQMKHFLYADMGHRVTFGAALEVRFVAGLHGLVEVFGQNGFNAETASTPMEADGALRYRFAKGLSLTVGCGGGIIKAIGSPAFRVFGGLSYAPVIEKKVVEVEKDSDNDGILDRDDSCPFKAEDPDGFEDEDGCPDTDNDKDGIGDKEDQCPNEAEDIDGFEDKDGCPDTDNDKDGIGDKEDQCPNEAEDIDGFEDEDGCPDTDNDKDGITDDKDGCPDEAEDEDGFEDDDGCPDTDNDQDGIPDDKDECPNEKEVFNGFEDEDGCPDKGKALVVIEENQIKLLQKIHFATNSDKIIKKKSFKILDTIARIIETNPDIKVRIEGHTDNKGTHEHNMDLSRKRAESVKKYLVEQGINEGRLDAVGHGPDKPIADNNTKKGRAENRRVEFHII